MSIGNMRFDDGIKKINANETKTLDVLIVEKTIETKNAIIASQNVVTGAITGKGVVKSVQRGIADSGFGSGSGDAMNISISSINPSKSLIFVNGYGDAKQPSMGVYGRITSATNIEIRGGITTYTKACWQVVEFY